VLTRRRLQELKAEAHHLEPIVHIGHSGLHEAAFAAVVLALRDHELIKVRLHEPENKRAMAEELAKATASALCGLVGHTVILYKPKPQPKRAPDEQTAERPRVKRVKRVKPGAPRGRAQRGPHTRTSSSSRRRASSS
jgi:RNA-binding protein